MSDFKSFLEEQMKSEEFRREFEALAPDYELVFRGDIDPRNLCYLINPDGSEFNDYQRGYNDGVIAAYWLTRNAKAVEAEPVVHAHWNGDCCSRCGELAEENYPRCPYCGAHMDEEVACEKRD